jgi:diguanylate cyclase (GGDEF)-like protein/PAS domain S-box-containing protein
MRPKYFATFLSFLLIYALVILGLSQEGDAKFEHLHLLLDTGNGILSLMLALFLLAEQYNIKSNVRQYLVIGFSLAALTEILHALIGIEWSGSLVWIQNYSHKLRPATWPPSTYVLPLAIMWLLWLEHKRISLRPSLFAAGMIFVTIVLFTLGLALPKYMDTGILGIQRPTQIPLLFLWAAIIVICWRTHANNSFYEGIIWMGVLLFLSDVCMLYSTSPHEKFTMMAHSGKLLAYVLLHIIQMRLAAKDSRDLKLAEDNLRIAAIAFEAQEGIFVTDSDCLILRVNRAFTKIAGYTAAEVIGKHPRIFKSGRHNTDFYAAMWESIDHTGAWEGEIWNLRKNGEIYPEQLAITAVKDQDGVVTNHVAIFSDITLSKAAADEIERLAFYDPLTGLPNRRLLQDRLRPAFAASQRSGRKGALLFIDMDNFKTLNDIHGHHMGDLLLQQVAKRLTACVRENDTVARLGGDEFVVMLENLSEQTNAAGTEAEMVGNKILATLNQPYLLATHRYHSTPSIGATLFNDHEQTEDDLLKQADIAMYQAKASGRNTLRFFDPKMQASMTARFVLEADLHLALTKNQFQLSYQPQVCHNRQIIDAEVLIRWHHPQRGLVSPADFIPLAEETGLILPIGQWVLETACTQIKLWKGNKLTQHLQLAVNISAKQFHQPDFVEQVRQVLQHNAINPNKLKLELTESVVLKDIDDTIIKMQALREIGVRFSMDDFGTGYSSLAYLTHLPFDQIKIDQSFVRNIGVKNTDALIVQTIIGMANNLGMEVIAEGVETEEQRAFLEHHGCLRYQGYLFSKPVPLEEFEHLLKLS